MPTAETMARQAELEKRHRDLTKPVLPAGSDGDSLRAVKGFEGITDEMLKEREMFSLGKSLPAISKEMIQEQHNFNLHLMSVEELHGLAEAVLNEAANRQKES